MASQQYPTIRPGDHKAYMEFALEIAKSSPPSPDKFCVGALLVDADANKILSTGFSLEFPQDYLGDPGTTHAERCCLIKISLQNNKLAESRLGEVLPPNTILYTTMEPCNERLSGKKTCVDRILALKKAIKIVYVGIAEPDTFIKKNEGIRRLEEAGIKVEIVEGLRDKIMKVSMAGHEGWET